jgi:hypothetical protein
MEAFSYDWLEIAVQHEHRAVFAAVLTQAYLKTKALLQKRLPEQLQLAQCYVVAASCFTALDENSSALSNHVYQLLQVSYACTYCKCLFLNFL